MSEDLVARAAQPLGRLSYLSLGSTTLQQLRKSRFIRSTLSPEEEKRKPDGIVFLPVGGIKAVVEIKQPKELTAGKLAAVVEKYAPIANAVCRLLILTDGKKSHWYNAATRRPVIGQDGHPVQRLFDPAAVSSGTISSQDAAEIVSLIEMAEHSLRADNDQLLPRAVIDPTNLSKKVWQKIWVNTGKEPEKCLYNVVEILVFKFLSDTGVLTGQHSFKSVVEVLANEGANTALEQYANMCRPRIRTLFPKSEDGTTIINGTIFVNEKGDPNKAQASLFGEVIEAFQAFDNESGSLKYIDRQFKTRLYESFLRQQAGIRSLGQYFTPRNVVQEIVRMSRAGSLTDGAAICDPFCGVGGFLLEAIAENPNLLDQFRPQDGVVAPRITFRGYDKGTDEKEDERTIILAKANMLVYLSDLLAEYHSENVLDQFARHAFNDTFQLLRSNLGTFGRVDPSERYDLILTNPPYVTSGSASLRTALEAANLTNEYTVGGRGTESLAIQWIVNHLKPKVGQAFVVVPDGLLNQAPILRFVEEKAMVRAIVALPSRTFYSTPKKTFILAVDAKPEPGVTQTEPVFTYLVSEIGESRDTRRIPINDNDLPTMREQFGYFSTNRAGYTSSDPRCKIVAFDDLRGKGNWLIDRNWSAEEKVSLGIVEEAIEVDADTLKKLIDEARQSLEDLLGELA
ncbi:MAG: N-6 DNA methylase [Propionicimonas sp.]|uniref:HsdM family class I SAM-dependent methyltransferase n=1 Tax=Propionicimonas sp. TaxID=1955623 RepID=UPI003D0EEC77